MGGPELSAAVLNLCFGSCEVCCSGLSGGLLGLSDQGWLEPIKRTIIRKPKKNVPNIINAVISSVVGGPIMDKITAAARRPTMRSELSYRDLADKGSWP